ncbi:MAG: hypothetical protein ACREJW_10205, partial [Candidatus Methylomirabilales bacterium]
MEQHGKSRRPLDVSHEKGKRADGPSIRELSLLNAVAEAVGRSLNQEEVLRAALEKIAELEEVRSAYVLLKDLEEGGMKIVGDEAAAGRGA